MDMFPPVRQPAAGFLEPLADPLAGEAEERRRVELQAQPHRQEAFGQSVAGAGQAEDVAAAGPGQGRPGQPRGPDRQPVFVGFQGAWISGPRSASAAGGDDWIDAQTTQAAIARVVPGIRGECQPRGRVDHLDLRPGGWASDRTQPQAHSGVGRGWAHRALSQQRRRRRVCRPRRGGGELGPPFRRRARPLPDHPPA